MRPQILKTKIFLDSGDVNETRQIKNILGFLDGQTTNPTLIAKNANAQGKKFTKDEIFSFYKEVVKSISSLIPDGSVSVEVYSDAQTSADEMFTAGKEMFTWIPNAHIKYPTTKAGLEAAQKSVQAGIRVNMTLVFSQEQAAAVYAATKGAKRGDVFVSPFIGRLDDRGENGMDLIKNILKMYRGGDGHVQVLGASIRNINHFLYSIALGCHIITVPYAFLKEWADKRMPTPHVDFSYKTEGLSAIPYQEIDLDKPYTQYNISHGLTDLGLQKFADDWNGLIL